MPPKDQDLGILGDRLWSSAPRQDYLGIPIARPSPRLKWEPHVILVERNGKGGGNFTSSLVSTFCGHYTVENGKDKPICSGLGERIFSHLSKENAIGRFIYHARVPVVPVDGPVLTRVLDEMLIKAGVQVLFHQLACDVVVEDKRVKAVIVSGKSGQYVIRCKTVIDCTGDGDIAFMAGVPVLTDGGYTQFPTLMFHLGGVDFVVGVKNYEAEYLDRYHLVKAVQTGNTIYLARRGPFRSRPARGMVQANRGLQLSPPG